jgi:AcrR family transcriptional regulator
LPKEYDKKTMIMETNSKLNQILEAATETFARFGYRKASMDDIAQKLGMTKSNLYFYCENKQDLYQKAVAHALMKWQIRVQEAIDAERDIVQRFQTLSIKSLEYLHEDADLLAIITADPDIQAITPSEERFPTIGRTAYALVNETIRQAVDEGRFRAVDVDKISGFLYAIYCTFIIKTYIKSEGQSAQDMYLAGVDVILHGLLAKND